MQPAAAIARIALVAICAGVVGAQAGQGRSTFQMQMKIRATCKVSTRPANIDLGSVTATSATVDRSGSTIFKVNCSRNTPFYIGMAPSAANGGTADGTGHLKGVTGGNTDRIPYTLYSNAALTTVWGNRATRTSVGNGVAGTGAGMAGADALSLTAWAKTVSADFRPDRYTDTVRVGVHY